MREWAKALFKSRREVYTWCLFLLVAKATILGINAAEAILGGLIVGLEGFIYFYENKKKEQPKTDLEQRISNIESKVNLANLRK